MSMAETYLVELKRYCPIAVFTVTCGKRRFKCFGAMTWKSTLFPCTDSWIGNREYSIVTSDIEPACHSGI
jgi:hypothetical protein